MEEVAKIAQAPLESPCTAMGLLGNWALLQSILPLPCSLPHLLLGTIPTKDLFPNFCRKHYFHPHLPQEIFSLSCKSFSYVAMPHMLPNTKKVIIIYTQMHFSTSPPRTALNESVLGSGLTTLNKKNPKQ